MKDELGSSASVRHGLENLRTIGKLLQETMRRIVERSKNPTTVTGVSSGFDELDLRTSGMTPGELTLVAGRKGVGKTTFSLNIAEQVAMGLGLPVMVFSPAMAGPLIAAYLLSAVAKVNLQNLLAGRLDTSDWELVAAAKCKLDEAPLTVQDDTSLTAHELCVQVRYVHRHYGGLGLIVVDHVQAFSMPVAGGSAKAEISDTMRLLKSLSTELQVPIFAILELKNTPVETPDAHPTLADLRVFGPIERDADVVLFLHGNTTNKTGSSVSSATEVFIAKQRFGSPDVVKLAFSTLHSRFNNFNG